jgi:hypothetical protein
MFAWFVLANRALLAILTRSPQFRFFSIARNPSFAVKTRRVPSQVRKALSFRLVSLFTGVSLLCGLLGYESQRARSIRQLTENIKQTGGCISFFHRFGDGFCLERRDRQLWRKHGKSPPGNPVPNWQQLIAQEEFLVTPREACLTEASVRQGLLVELCQWESVTSLVIEGATDENIQPLKRLENLEEIFLNGRLSPKGVSLLLELPRLKTLYLSTAELSDDATQLLENAIALRGDVEFDLP